MGKRRQVRVADGGDDGGGDDGEEEVEGNEEGFMGEVIAVERKKEIRRKLRIDF